MGAAGLLWVFLALITPGVLGELGGGARRSGRDCLGQGRSLRRHAKQSPKREGGGSANRLPASRSLWGDPRDLLVLKALTLGPRGWDRRTWRLHCRGAEGALCDLPGEAVACTRGASGSPRACLSRCFSLSDRRSQGHTASFTLH